MSATEVQSLDELLESVHLLTGLGAAVYGTDRTRRACCPQDMAAGSLTFGEGADAVAAIVYNDTNIGYLQLGRLAHTCVPENDLRGMQQLAEVLASYIAHAGLLESGNTSLQGAIAEYISGNLSEDLSVQTLCRKFSVSKSELYRVLRRQAPNGVAAYVRKKRLSRSCELLRRTGKPVWQIAEEIGYDNPDYFLRAFKKEYGISAGKYRKASQEVCR